MPNILKHSESQAELLDHMRNVITKQLVESGYMSGSAHMQLSDFDDYIIEVIDINDTKVIKKTKYCSFNKTILYESIVAIIFNKNTYDFIKTTSP